MFPSFGWDWTLVIIFLGLAGRKLKYFNIDDGNS